RSATDTPSAPATLQSVAIDGFASPFSIWTSRPLLTSESAASRSSDKRRSTRRARRRDDSTLSSGRSERNPPTAFRGGLVTGSVIHWNDRCGQYNDRVAGACPSSEFRVQGSGFWFGF